MKRFRIRILVVSVLLFALGDALAASVSVQLQSNQFVPSSVTIQQGDTVVWVASASGHDTVSYDGIWNSGGLIPRGQTFSFTFSNVAPGTYRYKCTPHENFGMIGTVIVQGVANTPPTVAITSPANGTSFTTSDSINFSANATDNGNVVAVEFFANGASLGTDTSAPYSLSSTLAAGTYSITAKATDNQNASTTSEAITINVSAPNPPPVVSITSPSEGETVSFASDIIFSAAASDNGRVTSVEFFTNNVSIVKVTASPFSITTKLPPGSYTITAKATDNLGAITTSTAVHINVQGPVLNELPLVTLSSNSSGKPLPVGTVLQLTATASDPDGSIVSVDFFSGTNPIGSVATSPYEVTLSDLPAGIYSFTAVATDNFSGKTTSEVVQVRITARPIINSITRDANETTITVTGTSGIPLKLERTSAFETWTAVEISSGSDGTATFKDTTDAGRRFYRAVVD